MEMDFDIDLFIYAIEKNKENYLFELWKLQYPQMDKENFENFTDYKNRLLKKQETKNKTTEKTYEEIEKEMKEVEKAFGRR